MLNVAIVGRPNVGKSTLFNRLIGTKAAIVADTPGVTRDRQEGAARIGPLDFLLYDTAGLEDAAPGSLSARMTAQTLEAVENSDLVMMVIDGRAGLTSADRHFAALLRKTGKKVLVLVNKSEHIPSVQAAIGEVYSLGFGEPIPVSAEHGEGMNHLYEVLARCEHEEIPAEPEAHATHESLTLAIVGRPNAGKSTLINHMLGQERLLTGPEAGITRDAISVPFTYADRTLTLVDTAGLRRRSKIDDALERMSAADALKSIRRANVVVVLMDATLAFEKQDIQLADLAAREGRAVVLAVSKWDLVSASDRKKYMETCRELADSSLPQLSGIPIIPISTVRNIGMPALMQAAFHMHELWSSRLTTGPLNRWLEAALMAHAPPMVEGRRLKIRYLTQTRTRPPSFTVFCNMEELPGHYERYMVNSLRKHFKLDGVPIRLNIRKGKNPYDESDDDDR